MGFSKPQAILFVRDPERSADLYRFFGFVETFRTPDEKPIKVEMSLDGFELGLAEPAAAATHHQIEPVIEGDRACITLWTDDIDVAYVEAQNQGALPRHAPHSFLDGQLRVAFLYDLDGHPIQLVQRAH